MSDYSSSSPDASEPASLAEPATAAPPSGADDDDDDMAVWEERFRELLARLGKTVDPDSGSGSGNWRDGGVRAAGDAPEAGRGPARRFVSLRRDADPPLLTWGAFARLARRHQCYRLRWGEGAAGTAAASARAADICRKPVVLLVTQEEEEETADADEDKEGAASGGASDPRRRRRRRHRSRRAQRKSGSAADASEAECPSCQMVLQDLLPAGARHAAEWRELRRHATFVYSGDTARVLEPLSDAPLPLPGAGGPPYLVSGDNFLSRRRRWRGRRRGSTAAGTGRAAARLITSKEDYRRLVRETISAQGEYTFRALFLYPHNGSVMTGVYNTAATTQGDTDSIHFYYTAEPLLRSVRDAIAVMQALIAGRLR